MTLAGIQSAVSFTANIVEILVGASVLYVAWTQREKISAAFSILFGYSLQSSLSDLSHWLEKLQEYCSDGRPDPKKVRMALAYIAGKIKGNDYLFKNLGDKIVKQIRVQMENIDEGAPIDDASLMALYSEIKEKVASLGVQHYSSKL